MLAERTQDRDDLKESGIEWLGGIPKSWETKKLKYLFRDHSEKGRPEACLLSVTQSQGVVPRTWVETRMVMPAGGLEGFKFIRKGDFAISLRAFEGGLEYCYHDGIISPAYTVMRSNMPELHDGYYRHLFKSCAFISELQTSVVGIREGKNVSFQELSHSFMPIPPRSEQEKIARFLDAKTEKIDAAIALEERQIALLKERKQIVIQDAVTKGLNPNAPMKDSGVDWIGVIPAHWRVQRAKYLFREMNERSASGAEELLSVSHMTGVTPRAEKNIYMFMAEDYSGSKLCEPGDLVYNIMWAWMGALGVSDHRGIVSPSYAIFRPFGQEVFNRKYLEWLMRSNSYVEHYNKVSTGLHSSRLRFYSHMFFDMSLGYPAREEQENIVAYIEEEVGKIDAAIRAKVDSARLLAEYKVTLISSAVTGKINVT